MGFRTVVVLFNDQCSEWENDPDLGKRISHAMNHATDRKRSNLADIGYGRVVECAHADCQTLAVLDGYMLRPLVHTLYRRGEPEDERNVRLLRDLAGQMGFRVVRKTTRARVAAIGEQR
jgi:hypothetical protein